MDDQLCPGVIAFHFLEVAGPYAGVYVTLARPYVELTACDPGRVCAEEHVREEEYFLVFGYGLDDLDGVRRRAAVIALCLHLGGRVDVRNDDRARMLALPRPQLIGRYGVGKRAPRF